MMYERVGEIKLNNFGSEMIIVEYRSSKDIDIYFPQYDWTAKGMLYDKFKMGKIKCPYEPRAYGVGYMGEGKYKGDSKHKIIYNHWLHMLRRCYCEEFYTKHTTYIDCYVCDEWLNFQNFAKWHEDNYYVVGNERMSLDKDILVKGNKLYSPSTCIFVPQRINSKFVKCDKQRGNLPIGVSFNKSKNKYCSCCKVYNEETNKSKTKHLGDYDTIDDAFLVYKNFKENSIKELAEKYKDVIPKELYEAMMSYEVEIDD